MRAMSRAVGDITISSLCRGLCASDLESLAGSGALLKKCTCAFYLKFQLFPHHAADALQRRLQLCDLCAAQLSVCDAQTS